MSETRKPHPFRARMLSPGRLRTHHERRADIHLGLLRFTFAVICYRQLKTSF
jgi:hypothetical protein